MTAISFDVAVFRLQFPAYANTASYPDILIETWWDIGSNYVSTEDYGYLAGTTRLYALNLMAAHLIYLNALIAAGTAPAQVVAAGVGGVSVSTTPPPVKSQWDYWLSLSPYGLQLGALLHSFAVGGLDFVGGLPETSAFRKVYGVF